jgi:hypothetical protein
MELRRGRETQVDHVPLAFVFQYTKTVSSDAGPTGYKTAEA